MGPSKHITECIDAFYEKLFESGRTVDVSIAIVLSHGDDLTGDNQILAEIAKRFKKQFSHVLLIVQREVYWAAQYGLTDVVAIGYPSRVYIPINEVLDNTVNICSSEQVSTVLLICHPHTYSFAKEYLEKHGLTVQDP